jgi:hypothetical protein
MAFGAIQATPQPEKERLKERETSLSRNKRGEGAGEGGRYLSILAWGAMSPNSKQLGRRLY